MEVARPSRSKVHVEAKKEEMVEESRSILAAFKVRALPPVPAIAV